MPINVSSGSMQNSTVSGIDTGTGGFIVDSDNFAHVYDVGELDSSGVPLPQWSPGDINVDKTKKDLPKSTKSTLADYLGRSTVASKNSYPLDTSSKVDLTLTDDKGYPQHHEKVPNTQPHFADLGPGRSTAAVDLNVLRGKQSPINGAVDGNDLLNAKASGLPSKPAKDYYSKVISANRFAAGASYENNSEINTSLNSIQFAKKYPMGESLKPDDPRRDLTFGRLAQIGSVLSLRSSHEAGAFGDEFNPTNETAIAMSMLPGSTQLGVKKINVSRLTAESVIDHLTKTGIDGDLLIDPAGQSWGSLNNVQDEFSGISAFGMQLLAVALIIALTIIMSAMSALLMIPGGKGFNSTIKGEEKPERRPLGSYHEDYAKQGQSIAAIIASGGSFNFWRMIGVEATENAVSDCLFVGALAFFGVDTGKSNHIGPGDVAISVAKGLVSVTESPGYYSIIARNVSRSFLQMSDAFASVGKMTGVASGAKQVLSIIDTLRSSKFIRIINVFAHLGDQVLSETATLDPTDSSRYISRIDTADNFDGGKGRININQPGLSGSFVATTLSWTSRRTPSSFLFPKQISDYGSSTTTPYMQGGILTKPTSSASHKIMTGSVSVSRIDAKDRISLENELNSEYMPFYIHDVRTNEIVSFHAFLASLTDDYSANYDSADGVGRVEAIKIYKSTNRKIGFSFFLVATSPDDFDDIWLKINKLTTLVYPQFSEGRKISVNAVDKDSTFTMPFSQRIQAAPLVRVRIGDLIKSNYNDFSMNRLFGADSPDFSIGKKEQSTKPEPPKVPPQTSHNVGDTYRMNNIDDMNALVAGIGGPGFFLKMTAAPNDKGIATFTVITVPSDDIHKYKDVLPRHVAQAEQVLKRLNNKQKSRLVFSMNVNGVHKTADLQEKDDKDATAAAASSATAEEKKTAVETGLSSIDKTKFLNDNAIAKSFKSAGGEGLAGFIDSMGFDWYDKVTWEIQPGRKAPKMCKVTISFTPVHDITPGLDHNGFNRAPIYNIGPQP